jgi:hypothetical protein
VAIRGDFIGAIQSLFKGWINRSIYHHFEIGISGGGLGDSRGPVKPGTSCASGLIEQHRVASGYIGLKNNILNAALSTHCGPDGDTHLKAWLPRVGFSQSRAAPGRP